MITRRAILSLPLASAVIAFAPLPALADEPVKVVATFSILADLAERVGGEHVEVTALVGAGSDPHVYRPTPADAQTLAGADILIENGLTFEGWLERLEEASGFSGKVVVASTGIETIEGAHDDHDDHEGEHDDHDDHGAHDDHDGHNHGEKEMKAEKAADHDHDHGSEKATEASTGDDHDHDHDDGHGHDDDKEHGDDHAGHDDHDHGDEDPHAWHNPLKMRTYVSNMADAFAEAVPGHADEIRANASAMDAELVALDAEIKAMFADLAADHRTVVTTHDAFGYFADAYDLTFLAPQGLSTETQPSASEVAEIVRELRELGHAALFVENSTDPRLIETIASETDLTIGGTLYPEALSDADGPAATYIELMRHNATQIAEALKD